MVVSRVFPTLETNIQAGDATAFLSVLSPWKQVILASQTLQTQICARIATKSLLDLPLLVAMTRPVVRSK